MLVLRENPVGIDVEIGQKQREIYRELGWGDYDSYGRCYKELDANGYLPKVYIGNNNYRDVLWDDKLSAISFFSVADKRESNHGGLKTTVSLIFLVNLEKIIPKQQRADEEVREMVLRCFTGQELLSIETGLDNALKEYDRSKCKVFDTHPLHSFRINFQILYTHN